MTRKNALAVVLIAAAFALLAAHVFAAEGPRARGERIASSVTPACRTCHAANLNPLAGFAERSSREDARLWIRDPEAAAEKAGKRRPKMPAYGPKKLPDDDLEALVEYIFAPTPTK